MDMSQRRELKLFKKYLVKMEEFLRWEEFPGMTMLEDFLVAAGRLLSAPKCWRDAVQEIKLWKLFLDKLAPELSKAFTALKEDRDSYMEAYEKLVTVDAVEDMLDSDNEFPVALKELILEDREDRGLLKMEEQNPVEVSEAIKDQFKSLPSLKSKWEEKLLQYHGLNRFHCWAKKLIAHMEHKLDLSEVMDDVLQDEEEEEEEEEDDNIMSFLRERPAEVARRTRFINAGN